MNNVFGAEYLEKLRESRYGCDCGDYYTITDPMGSVPKAVEMR